MVWGDCQTREQLEEIMEERLAEERESGTRVSSRPKEQRCVTIFCTDLEAAGW